MNLIDLEPPQNRAGHIVCNCDEGVGGAAEPLAPPALAATALGYGLNILSQTLTIAVLPIAGATLAPRPLFATLPYAATLVGALVASLVAALLNNLFGRRAAFATGASLGIAGAGLAAWSTFQGQFAGLCLGAFWLGTAQAFGLFYRHSAAIHGRDPKRAVAIVLGAGALAAVSAPSLMQLAQVQAGPFAPAMALALAGLVQVAVSALSLLQPGRSLAAPRLPRATGIDMNFLLATAIGASAWFGRPAGHASVTLLKLLPESDFVKWDRKSTGYSQRKHLFADQMIASAEEVIPGLRQHITYRQGGIACNFCWLRVDNRRFYLVPRPAETFNHQDAHQESLHHRFSCDGWRSRSGGDCGHPCRERNI